MVSLGGYGGWCLKTLQTPVNDGYMAGMTVSSSSQKAQSPLALGAAVVCTDGTIAGTDPFTRLVVVAVHKNGLVDLATLGGGNEWLNVSSSSLTVVAV